jgi:hypothetical protein
VLLKRKEINDQIVKDQSQKNGTKLRPFPHPREPKTCHQGSVSRIKNPEVSNTHLREQQSHPGEVNITDRPRSVNGVRILFLEISKAAHRSLRKALLINTLRCQYFPVNFLPD